MTVGEYSLKGFALNIATSLLFFAPFVIYAYQDKVMETTAAVVGAFVVTWFVPPVGWKKPHPLSDQPHNRG
ncbi:hypothetical protein M885DRAFT_544226 [Pelagophyceae sp. CCMP2097]|nr:hypothetical protein M885DRAFT_544226 [Pelagophyceae sp. CCMP2097]